MQIRTLVLTFIVAFVSTITSTCTVNTSTFVDLLNQNNIVSGGQYKSGLNPCALPPFYCSPSTITQAIGQDYNGIGGANYPSVTDAADAYNKLKNMIGPNAKFIGGACSGNAYTIYWIY